MSFVLGIGGLGYKDSAAALLGPDGRLVAAAAEERFSGSKHEGGFPHRAARFCLEQGGIAESDLGGLAVADNSWLRMRDKVLDWYGEGFFKSRSAVVYHVFKDEAHLLVEYLQTLQSFRNRGIAVETVPHALSHMAAAYYGSPFDSAALLTLDGRGDISTTGIGHAEGLAIGEDAVTDMPDSLGLLYALVAHHLGYSDLDDEFRLISISPTGTPSLVGPMREVVQVAGDGSCRLSPDYFGYHQGRAFLSERFSEVFGPPRDPALPLEDRHRDLAASLHSVALEVVLAMARRARDSTSRERLCLGGGLATNWGLVGAVCEAGIFDEVYLPPAPGDDGTALGAALHFAHAGMGLDRTGPLLRSDFGPSYSEEEIAAELGRLKLRAERPEDLAAAATDRIAAGEIVGWFQGGAEFGPRALGHRSILADPADPGTRSRLVASVKARSELHPFGLSVTREAAAGLFEEPAPDSPFLERTARLRPGARDRLPAVAAAGGRTRVHTVDSEVSPSFHELLVAVGRKIGTPAVLNTSLNEPGRPMATEPREAIGSLFTTGLDALVIGPFIVAK
jgi:carbamoyltransferase